MKQSAGYLLQTIRQALPFLRQITDEDAAAPPMPGKWSAKEIIGHLIDSAANNHQKFIRTIETDGVRFTGYNQDNWVTLQHYNNRSWQDLLALWEQYNHHLAHIMTHTDVPSLHHLVFIDQAGPFTLAFIMHDYTAHLKHHLRSILPDASFLSSSFKMAY